MASRQAYPQDHATHVPVLVGLGFLFPYITRIMEYGSGLYSTPLFLNRRAFPKVKEVISIESDLDWQKKVIDATNNDPRLVMYELFYSVGPSVDLIFVDNGPYEHKVETIREVCKIPGSIIVVHDSEVEAYKKELLNLRYRFDFQSFNPETSVGFNGCSLPLDLINRQIEKYVNDVAPNDVEGWIARFQDARYI